MVDNSQQYLSTLSETDASRIRAILIPAYKKSFQIIFYVGAALAAVGFVVAFFLMPQLELNRPDDEKLKEEGHQAQLKEKSIDQ